MSTDADRTPTDQKLLADGTPTQTIVADATPTDQQLVSGAMAVRKGTVIDARWQTEQCLASGGYGDVWQGVDLIHQRPVAVKILRTDAGNNDPSAIARMKQEAEILKAMSHPNIVSVYGFGHSPFGHFLVMEMLDGKAIDQLIGIEGPIDPERAIPMVRQLLGALGVAHSKQVLHRDLKPENIIIVTDADGVDTAKLVDFGIAKATRLLSDDDDGATLVQTRSGGFMGTPRYAAPEQAVGDPCGPNIDLFALGLVVAEWLTGKRRLDGQRHGDVMQQLLSTQPIDLSDVPYRWREWLQAMTVKDPRHRLQNAADAIEALDELVVNLHEPDDFVERPTIRREPLPSSFAANDGPLELDFDRAAQTSRPAPPVVPQRAPAPRAVPDEITGTRAILISTDDARRAMAGQPRNAGHKISRFIFMLAVGIISFAAVAVLIIILAGLFNS